MSAETLRLMGGIEDPSSDCSTEQAPSITRTAQLTIFYSGRVNIYDDVPADKAHAVMLLLSNGNGGNISSCEDRQSTKPVQANAKPSSTNTCNSVDAVRPRSSTPPRSSPSDSITQLEKKQHQQLVIKRSQAELPFARKASLARFLEKRKDRVDAKVVTLNQTLKDEDRPCKKINL